MELQSPAPQPNSEPFTPPTPPASPTLHSVPPGAGQPPAAGPMPQVKTKKSKLFKILGIVSIVLVVILVLLYIFMAPNLHANNVLNTFMKDMTLGDVSAAASLSDGGTSNSVYLSQVAKKVSGTYTLKKSEVKDGQHYYLYDLSKGTYKYARMTVKKVNGGYKVTSFVVSGTPLTLIPS